MKISEIKDRELRDLAELRRSQYGFNDEDELSAAFCFYSTVEGETFWQNVNNGTTTKIEEAKDDELITQADVKKELDKCFKEIPDYYIGSKYGYEARKVIEEFQPENYNVATAITYLLRAGKKKYVNDSSEDSLKADIEKAINHLNFELDRLND